MSIRKQSHYVIAIKAAQPKTALQVGAVTLQKPEPVYLKEATGEALLNLVQTNDKILEGAIIYEVKKRFNITPVTTLELKLHEEPDEKEEEPE